MQNNGLFSFSKFSNWRLNNINIKCFIVLLLEMCVLTRVRCCHIEGKSSNAAADLVWNDLSGLGKCHNLYSSVSRCDNQRKNERRDNSKRQDVHRRNQCGVGQLAHKLWWRWSRVHFPLPSGHLQRLARHNGRCNRFKRKSESPRWHSPSDHQKSRRPHKRRASAKLSNK